VSTRHSSLLALGFLLTAVSAAAEPFLIPAITGEWTRITRTPDLGELNGVKQQPVDFAVWQATDQTWQLMACIGGTKEIGKTRLLYRWESPELTSPNWKPVGIAMRADAALGETPGGLQAPYVYRDGGQCRMLYGDWVRICSATSTDGKNFTRDASTNGQPAFFSRGAQDNARDPCLLRVGHQSHLYYTAHPENKGAVYSRQSSDGKKWSPEKLVTKGGDSGDGPYSAECPFVVEHSPGQFYLFRTQGCGAKAVTRVYHSTHPENLGVFGDYGDALHFVGTLPVAAPELVKVGADWFIVALTPALDGHQIARLEWSAPPQTKPAPVAATGEKIRIALFDDQGSFGKGVPSCAAQLGAVPGMEVTKLDAEGIRAGLSGYHAIIFSGGSGGKQANTIGLRGREEVRRFVEAGGGYVGIRAGAYLVCSGFRWSVPVLDAKTPSSLWMRGEGNVKIETTPQAQSLLQLPAHAGVRYANGPILTPGNRADIPDYEPLVFFRSELSKTPKHEGLQINTPAIVIGKYGQGIVLACSPHPEQTAGMEHWIEKAVRAVLRR
jgi:hypothetical protein